MRHVLGASAILAAFLLGSCGAGKSEEGMRRGLCVPNRDPASIWGLYSPPERVALDVANLGFEEILAAFERFDTKKYEVISGYEKKLLENASAQAKPLDFSALPGAD